MKKIRITATPPGEAPVRIRKAWIGVTIPLANIPESQPAVWDTQGVLGKELGLFARIKRLLGIPVKEQPSIAYVVNAADAISALREQSNSVANWWERNAPHLLEPGMKLCFSASCCEEMTDSSLIHTS